MIQSKNREYRIRVEPLVDQKVCRETRPGEMDRFRSSQFRLFLGGLAAAARAEFRDQLAGSALRYKVLGYRLGH